MTEPTTTKEPRHPKTYYLKGSLITELVGQAMRAHRSVSHQIEFLIDEERKRLAVTAERVARVLEEEDQR